MSTTTRTPRVDLLQALRAFAALSVAFYHITNEAVAKVPGTSIVGVANHALAWQAGVDIFFVISGFVIVFSSRSLFATPGGRANFLIRRLVRIVPLYWMMTTAFLASEFVDRHAIHAVIGGSGYVLLSYLFIPVARPDGMIQPPLGLGWTLNYEMFFYAVFTPFLVLRQRKAVMAAIFGLVGFVVLGHVARFQTIQLATWSNPIILEFCLGMVVAVVQHKLRLGLTPRIALVALSIGLLHRPMAGPLPFAIPAVCLVVAAVSGRHSVSAKPRRALALLSLLGDASYALYLVHPFVMRGVDIALGSHVHGLAGAIAYTCISLALAQAAAIVLHLAFERPVTRHLRRLLADRGLVTKATVLTQEGTA